MEEIIIKEEYIQLNKLLKYLGIISTGGEAKYFIEENNIMLNDNEVFELRKKIRVDDQLYINGEKITIKKYEDK